MNNARTFAIWLGRVAANALAGGLAFAFVGAFCGGGAVFLISLLGAGAFGGILIGAIAGFTCGIAGIFIHLFPAMKAKPGDFWEPFFDLAAPIAFGQFWGTVVACAAYLAIELIASQFGGFDENLPLFSVGAPILMIIGAIAAAVFKRD